MPPNYKILYNGTLERFAQVKSVLTYFCVRCGTFAFQITLLYPFSRILAFENKSTAYFLQTVLFLSVNQFYFDIFAVVMQQVNIFSD